MSIRLKLVALVVIVGVANIFSFGAQTYISRHIRAIENEQVLLSNLESALMSFAYEANRLDSQDFDQQVRKIQLSKVSMDKAFDAVAAVELLPDINNAVRSSLGSLPRFRSAIDDGFNSFLSTAQTVGQGLEVYESTRVLDVTTAGAIKNLQYQAQLIAEEVAAIEQRTALYALVLIGIVFLTSITLGLVVTNRISNRIRAIERGIQQMKSGDLADRIVVTSRDELGRLSEDVNTFTEELGRSMARIKDASSTNISIKEQLVTSVTLFKQMVDAVDQGAAAINTDMNRLGSAVGASGETVETVESNVQTLKSVLSDQVTMIEESTAAVTEMISSVGSIHSTTVKKKESMDTLGISASDGLEKMQATTRIIQTIHNSIDEIHDTVAVINDMADRTNLLAMNAAIEAAHAGESGKGFAVVADEIRKLAEASSTNSHRINDVLSGIISNIQNAAESGEITRDVFRRIGDEVHGAVAAFEEIAGSTAEVQAGGRQILEAMSQLNTVSTTVTESSAAMAGAVVENRKATEEVTSLSRQVVRSVDAILESARNMNTSLEEVAAETDRIDTITETLDREVSVFHTGVDTDTDIHTSET
ncbi:MAG: methyl-accepting chemotaxis protein [Alkalispirochaeta sp.]